MKQMKWLGIKLVEQLGWPGVAGLAMLMCWSAFYLTQVYPLHQKVSDMRAAAAGSNVASTRNDAPRELEAFKASFRRGTLEDQLKVIHDSGKATGLAFKRIEYRMLEERRSGLRQYQITMPVSSSYPSIRQFTSRALSRMPSLSLDHIHFQRKKIGDPAIEAELRFTLFLADPA